MINDKKVEMDKYNNIQKQLFADVLQNRRSYKFANFTGKLL